MSADAAAWKVAAGGVSVRVRVTPKSSKDTIDGVETTAEGPALKARVRAVPENGAANAAVCELVARAAGVAKRSVALTHGGKSRVKVLMIEGDPVEIVRRLEALAVDAGKAGGKR